MPNIILFGPPASGKGTQAKIFAQKFGLKHISTGDMFRAHIKNNTEIGRKVLQIEDGKYASDEITIAMVKNEVFKNSHHHFIFDGFPRTTTQAMALDEMMTISKKIFLNVEKEVLKHRILERKLKENRTDDDLIKFENRYRDYEESRGDLNRHYHYNTITNINGSLPVGEVTDLIFKAIIS